MLSLYLPVFFKLALYILYLFRQFSGLSHLGAHQNVFLSGFEQLFLLRLYFACGRGSNSLESRLSFIIIVLLTAVTNGYKQLLSVVEYVLDRKLYFEIFVKQIANVFEVLKANSHVFSILKLSTSS